MLKPFYCQNLNFNAYTNQNLFVWMKKFNFLFSMFVLDAAASGVAAGASAGGLIGGGMARLVGKTPTTDLIRLKFHDKLVNHDEKSEKKRTALLNVGSYNGGTTALKLGGTAFYGTRHLQFDCSRVGYKQRNFNIMSRENDF